MSYIGKSLFIPLSEGGLNANPNVDSLPPTAMIPGATTSGTRNLNLNKGGREQRGGTKIVHDTTFTAMKIMGLSEFSRSSGTPVVVFGTCNGNLYGAVAASTAICTSWTTGHPVSMETFEDEIYFSNGYDLPVMWNGTCDAVYQFANVAADWADGTNAPRYMIRHGRGASERMIAFGCPTTPYTIYISPSGDGDDFSAANVTTINIDTGDGHGIIGAVVFMDSLILFGKTRSYILDDMDTDTGNWGYWEATWKGGAAHHKVVIPVPNDVVVMSEDGEIYSIVAAEQTKDYRKSSISRPAFIHEWIKDNIDLSKIAEFHGIYDPVLRAIKIFVIRNTKTTIDTALVYFIDKSPEEGWMIHDNLVNTSGYSACSSALVRVGTGDYDIYTGDYSGNIWQLEQSTESDNEKAITAGFLTPPMSFGDIRLNKNYKRGALILDPTSDAEVMTVDYWVDGSTYSGKALAAAATTVTDYEFGLGRNGNRLQLEVYNKTSGQGFYASGLTLDYKLLGEPPEQ